MHNPPPPLMLREVSACKVPLSWAGCASLCTWESQFSVSMNGHGHLREEAGAPVREPPHSPWWARTGCAPTSLISPGPGNCNLSPRC